MDYLRTGEEGPGSSATPPAPDAVREALEEVAQDFDRIAEQFDALASKPFYEGDSAEIVRGVLNDKACLFRNAAELVRAHAAARGER